jgi:hypothetical protein
MTDKPVAAKLLIRPGDLVWLSDPERAPLLGVLPDGASVVGGARPGPDARVAVVIAPDGATVRAALAAAAESLRAVPILWVLYPKGGRADVNRDTLWPILAVEGLRPITQVAVDETWSALRFRPLRPDEPPFSGGA